jgi:signal peptide peptidase SppA
MNLINYQSKAFAGRPVEFGDCAAQHFGVWAVEPKWFSQAVEAYKSGILAASKPKDAQEEFAYALDEAGLAHIQINGQITKGRSSFGGASAVMTRIALRQARADDGVKAVMLHIDSPGGSVSGIYALAKEIRDTDAVKPVFTHAEDNMDSAALWLGVQARHVTASPMTEAGSIGVYAVLYDESKRAEMQGVKVHVISTGGVKGAAIPGTEITDEQLSIFQKSVDEVAEFFIDAVSAGRKMQAESVRKLATGEVWKASEARKLGLIDAVMSDDEAVAYARNEIRKIDSDRRMILSARANAVSAKMRQGI